MTRTRFAPAPTGHLHLGHVANAIHVWGFAAATGARVLLRIEDHDRQRSRREFDAALLEDLAWLGFEADEGPVRQSDSDEPYERALAQLRRAGLAYACDCTRATFAAAGWRGAGCPGGCRDRAPDERGEVALRVALGDGEEAWRDGLRGASTAAVAPAGDLVVRDRHRNWTYGFAVVVDDLRHDVDLVIRGEDLLEATASQIRLGRLLGRPEPPSFRHHPLIRKASGAKLSKADRDTSVRELRAAGASAPDLIGRAAALVELIEHERPIPAREVRALFAA